MENQEEGRVSRMRGRHMAKGRGAARHHDLRDDSVQSEPRQIVRSSATATTTIGTGRGDFARGSAESQSAQAGPSHRPGADRARLRGRRRGQHAQAGDDLRGPPGSGASQWRHPRRGRAGDPARRFRLPALARLQLSARPRRHLYIAEPDSEVQSSHGRYRLWTDSAAERGRALLRAAQSRIDQLRRS